MKKSIPNWVSLNKYKYTNKNINKLPLFKSHLLYFNCMNQDYIPYITWKELENYLDIIISKIIKTNIKFDGIISIGYGGAIMSEYISNKLGLFIYKINDKLENKNIILIEDIKYKYFNYLKKKKVNIIKSYCISNNKLNCDIDYATNDKILLYPWMILHVK
jgi:hypothetical protein